MQLLYLFPIFLVAIQVASNTEEECEKFDKNTCFDEFNSRYQSEGQFAPSIEAIPDLCSLGISGLECILKYPKDCYQITEDFSTLLVLAREFCDEKSDALHKAYEDNVKCFNNNEEKIKYCHADAIFNMLEFADFQFRNISREQYSFLFKYGIPMNAAYCISDILETECEETHANEFFETMYQRFQEIARNVVDPTEHSELVDEFKKFYEEEARIRKECSSFWEEPNCWDEFYSRYQSEGYIFPSSEAIPDLCSLGISTLECLLEAPKYCYNGGDSYSYMLDFAREFCDEKSHALHQAYADNVECLHTNEQKIKNCSKDAFNTVMEFRYLESKYSSQKMHNFMYDYIMPQLIVSCISDFLKIECEETHANEFLETVFQRFHELVLENMYDLEEYSELLDAFQRFYEEYTEIETE